MDALHIHAQELFSGTFLPSHDHTHHRRVWHICRNLLRELDDIKVPMDQSLVEGILIAAYFHDLGMIRSPRADHGVLGRAGCEEYFSGNGLKPPFRFREILDAIELHDLKEKKNRERFRTGKPPGILDILSVADDLEALGVIGIYRYSEIYLKRRIPLKELGVRILGNASSRFKNISEACALLPVLMNACVAQYDELVTFFDCYNQQLLTVTGDRDVFDGHVGIVNYIRSLTTEGDTEPGDIVRAIGRENRSVVVRDYFTLLKNELDKARL